MKWTALVYRVGVMLLITSVGLGQPATPNTAVAKQSPAEIQTLRMIRAGGPAVRRDPGASIQLIDARQAGAPCDLGSLINELESAFGISFSVTKKPALKDETPMKIARAALQDKGVGVAIIVLEEGMDAPMLSVFPEDRMAFVNATRICAGANKEVSEKRISTEIWRAISFAAGGVNSYAPHCALSSTVLEPKDIDQLSARVASPEVCEQVSKSAEKLGLARVKVTTYRMACMQGWAPMPTNSFQKAIWEEVKAKKAAGKVVK
ncbi:MAG: hypothetical protein WCP12_17480 [bacterium]